MEYIYTQYLQDSGLSEQQAIIYELLLKNGNIQASRLSRLSGYTRPLVYKILEQLIEQNLAEKIDTKGTIARFNPQHPQHLQEKVWQRIEQMQNAQSALDGVVGNMSSLFNFIAGKPNVQFFEGEKGLQRVYDDIILTKKDIYLLRSPYDLSSDILDEMVHRQIKRQVQHNIHTKALTPNINKDTEAVKKKDRERLVTRKLLPRDRFMIPAQIILYGHKVSITAFTTMFTTVIDDKDIHETFEKIFDYMWNMNEAPAISQKTEDQN